MTPEIERAIERIEALKEGRELARLATYVKNVTYAKLTAEEIREHAGDLSHLDRRLLARRCIGYDVANALSRERLQELFDQDDWNDAWLLADSEDTENFENDNGALEALNAALDILREEAGLRAPATEGSADR